MAKKRGGGGGLGRVVLGFVLGAVAVGGAGFAYLKLHPSWATHTPRAATEDEPQGSRKRAARPSAMVPKDQRPVPPFGTSEDAFEGGAQVYRARCATCHGVPGQDAKAVPASSQLWKKRGRAVGVSGHAPGEIYLAVAHGVRGTTMPTYERVLSETQMWQVSLLLANADKELPDPVRRILMSR